MKRTYTVNEKEIELSEVSAVFENERMNGIMLHDVDDEYRDGDCVTSEYDHLPENDEEAADWINNTHSWDSDHSVMDTVEER